MYIKTFVINKIKFDLLVKHWIWSGENWLKLKWVKKEGRSETKIENQLQNKNKTSDLVL